MAEKHLDAKILPQKADKKCIYSCQVFQQSGCSPESMLQFGITSTENYSSFSQQDYGQVRKASPSQHLLLTLNLLLLSCLSEPYWVKRYKIFPNKKQFISACQIFHVSVDVSHLANVRAGIDGCLLCYHSVITEQSLPKWIGGIQTLLKGWWSEGRCVVCALGENKRQSNFFFFERYEC